LLIVALVALATSSFQVIALQEQVQTLAHNLSNEQQRASDGTDPIEAELIDEHRKSLGEHRTRSAYMVGMWIAALAVCGLGYWMSAGFPSFRQSVIGLLGGGGIILCLFGGAMALRSESVHHGMSAFLANPPSIDGFKASRADTGVFDSHRKRNTSVGIALTGAGLVMFLAYLALRVKNRGASTANLPRAR
jgi:hypothetical protein